MKKIIIDAYLAKNLGDDLFLYIVFERYKNKEVQWVLNTYSDDYREMFKDYKNVEVRKKSTLNKLLLKFNLTRKMFYKNESRKSDALVIIGGSIFMENSTWKEQYKRMHERLSVFNKNSKKVFVLGSNFGPFKSEEFVEYSKEIFRECYDICFRDEKSFNYFKNIDNVRVASDVVFVLQDKIMKKQDTLGISIIDISEREELKPFIGEYEKKLIEIVNYYTDNKVEVTLFSFCEKQGDLDVAIKVRDIAKNKEMIKIKNYEGDIKEYLQTLGSMENIIGSRFHSIILSQVFHQGVYPLVYSGKTLNILKDIGLDKNYIEIQDINNLKIEELDEVINNNKLNDLSSIITKSDKQFIKLDEFINRGSNNEK